VLGDISASSSSSSSDGLLTGPVYMFGRFWMSGAVLCCAVGLDKSCCDVLWVMINRQGWFPALCNNAICISWRIARR
jgi:hypothetical protein